MRRFILPGLVTLAAVGLLALLTFGVSQQTDASSIDQKVAKGQFPLAPKLATALPMLDSSQTKSLADFRGKVVVLNVFASWCDPCAAEAPLLASEQRTLAKHNATLVGVTYEDNTQSSQAFARRYHMTYPILRDVSGSFVHAFGATGVPETFIINRQGRIQALKRQPLTRQWLNQTLPHILAEQA